MHAQIASRTAAPRGRLSINRRDGESVRVGDSVITVNRSKGGVRLLIDAPLSVKVLRSELKLN